MCVGRELYGRTTIWSTGSLGTREGLLDTGVLPRSTFVLRLYTLKINSTITRFTPDA